MRIACFICLLFACFRTAAGADAPRPAVDWQKALDADTWSWDDRFASPLYCMQYKAAGYAVSLTTDEASPGFMTFEVRQKGKSLYSWKGGENTVFQIRDDKLYLAQPRTSGGTILAVDLKTGKELWSSRLQGLPLRGVSRYSSAITLTANDDIVTICGHESAGDYIEFKDVATGETVAHRIFSFEYAKPATAR